MPTEAEIKAKYSLLHDELSDSYYLRHELTKEEFDLQHGNLWINMETELIAEGYLPQVPDPDTIRAQEILASSPDAITMPEMWELMRIFGRRLGYRFD